MPRRAARGGAGGGPQAARAADLAALAGGPGAPRQPGGGLAALLQSRRGLVITAPIAASALVAGIVFLAFPGYGEPARSGPRAGAERQQGRCGPGQARRHRHEAPRQHHAGRQRRDRHPPGSHRPFRRAEPGPRPPCAGEPRLARPVIRPASPRRSARPADRLGPARRPRRPRHPEPVRYGLQPAANRPKLPPGYSLKRVTAQNAGTTGRLPAGSAGFVAAEPPVCSPCSSRRPARPG